MRIALATVATRDYLPGAVALFESYSALSETEGVQFVCLTDSEDFKFPSHLQVKCVPFSANGVTLQTSKTVPRFSNTVRKLEAFRFLEISDFDTLFLIDSDIVFTRSVDLQGLAMQAEPIGAVRDFACEKYYSRELESVGLAADRIINTGFLLIRDSFSNLFTANQLMRQILESGKSYDGGDQGYLNWFLQQNGIAVRFLSPDLNRPLDVFYPLTLRPPSVVHFTGLKPWSVAQLSNLELHIRGMYLFSDWAQRLYAKHDRRSKQGKHDMTALVIQLMLWVAWIPFILGSLVVRTAHRLRSKL